MELALNKCISVWFHSLSVAASPMWRGAELSSPYTVCGWHRNCVVEKCLVFLPSQDFKNVAEEHQKILIYYCMESVWLLNHCNTSERYEMHWPCAYVM